MKILFISDIHGVTNNLSYLHKLDIKEQFDKIVVLGDLYYSYSYRDELDINPQKVSEFLNDFGTRIISLRGNCDSDYDMMINTFPTTNGFIHFEVDGINMYFTHGDNYSYRFRSKFNPEGVFIYGHEHIPYIKQEDGMTYVCIGSISVPRIGKPTYAIYQDKEITIYTIDNEVVDKIKLD
jgi:putative phosphoesterase